MTEFEAIYRTYFTDVELYLRGICKNESLAEALTEQVFFQALKALPKSRGDCDIRTWLCALCMSAGIFLRRCWYGDLLTRVGILTGSAAISAVIVTAGQLVDIYGRFTEMLVDSAVVALPMALFSLCVLQLVKLYQQDMGL